MKVNFKDSFLLYMKGIAMGAADVVPGVSGGTIAFITGIYEQLIGSIKMGSDGIRLYLLKGKFKEYFEAVNIVFLVTLLAGIATSILLLSRIVLYLLANHPIPVWAFFFGLIIASAVVVYRKIRIHNAGIILAAIIGTIFAFWITMISPTETRTDLWFIFICGAIAICAMILPGISGSFILLLLGKYEYILSSLQEMKISVILTFIAGCIVGIASFAHVLDWLLKRYHDIAVAVLAGFMIGSLNKVWPWKEVVLSITDRHGEEKVVQDRNLSPFNYLEVTGNQPELVMAIVMCFIGFFIVYFLEFSSNRKKLY